MDDLVTTTVSLLSRVVSQMDNRDEFGDRLVLTFKNGYSISIIRGQYSYGGKDGLFEIAPLDKEGGLNGSLLNLGDDVEGYLTKEDVLDRANRISLL